MATVWLIVPIPPFDEIFFWKLKNIHEYLLIPARDEFNSIDILIICGSLIILIYNEQVEGPDGVWFYLSSYWNFELLISFVAPVGSSWDDVKLLIIIFTANDIEVITMSSDLFYRQIK